MEEAPAPVEEAPAPVEEAPIVAVQVVFVIHGVSHEGTETVLVTGNDPLLGDWSAERAMRTTRQDDGAWRGELVVEPGKVLDFKLLRRGEDGSTDWEGGDNRSLAVGREQPRLEVALTWQ